MKITKNIPLLIGVALPVIFILVISIIIFIPALFIKPHYNFLYSNNDYYYDSNNRYTTIYEVVGNRLSIRTLPPTIGNTDNVGNPPLYVYDVKNNSAHQISWSEAKNFTIDSGPSSPDGYMVRYQYGSNGIFELFGSNSNQSRFVISKGTSSKKLHGIDATGGYYNSGNVKFIGWIK